MTPKLAGSLDSPAAKVLAVLATIAQFKAVPVSVLAEELGLPLPTAHRICVELERLGYVQRVPGTRHWTVARPLVEVAANVIAAATGDAITHAVLASVTHKISEMCSFAIQVADEVVYVASTEAPHAVTLSFRAGRKAPLFCTSSGRLFLSDFDEMSLESYLAVANLKAYTPFTITSRTSLRDTIRRVRQQGYAVTSQEYVRHVVGAAVPVRAPDGKLYGALSIAAPDMRMNNKSLRDAVPVLHHAATALAKSFGVIRSETMKSKLAKVQPRA